MSWRNPFARRAPVDVRIQYLAIQGEPVKEFTLDHWQGIARMFTLVPGLQDVLSAELDAAMADLGNLPATLDSERERIRIAQKVTDLKTFLDMPRRAVGKVNEIYAQQMRDQAGPESKPKGASNLA